MLGLNWFTSGGGLSLSSVVALSPFCHPHQQHLGGSPVGGSLDFMKFMKYLAGIAGFTSCRGDLKARSGVAGAVQGARAHCAWSFLCWESILGGPCACLAPALVSPGGETLPDSFLAPQGSVSSLKAESGVEVWGLGVQSCRTRHA